MELTAIQEHFNVAVRKLNYLKNHLCIYHNWRVLVRAQEKMLVTETIRFIRRRDQ